MAFNFLRISASIVLLFSILFMPFWVSVVLALAGIIYFPYFLETVAFFLLSDLLYGIKQNDNYPPIFISFIVALMAVVIVEILKKKVKFYN